MFLKTTRVFALIAGTCCLAGTSHAAFVGTGLAYGGNPSGGTVTCRLFNTGNAAISFTLLQIVTNTSAAVSLTGSSCSSSLGGGQACAFTASASGNLAYACRVGTSAAATNLTGVVEIQQSGKVLISSPLQK